MAHKLAVAASQVLAALLARKAYGLGNRTLARNILSMVQLTKFTSAAAPSPPTGLQLNTTTRVPPARSMLLEHRRVQGKADTNHKMAYRYRFRSICRHPDDSQTTLTKTQACNHESPALWRCPH